MLTVIKSLKAILEKCARAEPLSKEEADWLAGALANYLDHRCGSMDEAFGLRWPKGGVPWWLELGIRERNRALVDLAERFYPGRSVNAQAQLIAQLSLRYAAGEWRFDQLREEMPEHYRDTPREYLWLAFKSGAAMPLCERRLRSILAR